jgi:hypothetical protein
MTDYPRRGAKRTGYTDEEQQAFGRWVELGAKDPELQRFLDGSLSRRWERREPSGSKWVFDLLRDPRAVLGEAREIEGVTEDSRVTTTILHHERGLKKKVIVTTVTVEQQSGDVSMVIDKETRQSS